MISFAQLIQLLFLLAGLAGVWARCEIKIATLTERIRGNEKQRLEDKENSNTNWNDCKKSIDKVFEKVSHIENKLDLKQDKHYNQ